MATRGVLVCEHGVFPSSADLIRQEVEELDRLLDASPDGGAV
jgi:hypothetical protein